MTWTYWGVLIKATGVLVERRDSATPLLFHRVDLFDAQCHAAEKQKQLGAVGAARVVPVTLTTDTETERG